MSEKIEIGKTTDFEDGVMKKIPVSDKELLVVKVKESYYAADNNCPHMKAKLSFGTLEGTVVACPLHGSRFDLKDGRVVRWLLLSGVFAKAAAAMKTAKKLQTYKVVVEGDRLFVEI